jgi:hypothetical protein
VRPRPFGYLVGDDGKLRPHPEEALIVRQIVADFLDGASIRGIARGLNEQGIPSPRVLIAAEARAKGHRVKEPPTETWGYTTIRHMLVSPVLAGFLSHRRNVARDEHGNPVSVGEGLITEAERARVLAEIERRTAIVRSSKNAARVGGRTGGGRPPKYFLTGFAYCATCETRMIGGLQFQARTAYRCRRQVHGHPCPGAYVRTEDLDAEVVRRFTAKLAAAEPGDPILDAVAERWLAMSLPDQEADRATLATSFGEAEATLADLEEARFIRGEFADDGGAERYGRLRAKLVERRDAVRDALDALGPRPTVDVGGLLDTVLSREAWEHTPLLQQRALLALAVRKVMVRGADNGRLSLRERVHIVWVNVKEEAR